MLLVSSTCPKPLRYDLLNVTELGNPAALPLHLTAEIPAEALEAADLVLTLWGHSFLGRDHLPAVTLPPWRLHTGGWMSLVTTVSAALWIGDGAPLSVVPRTYSPALKSSC